MESNDFWLIAWALGELILFSVLWRENRRDNDEGEDDE